MIVDSCYVLLPAIDYRLSFQLSFSDCHSLTVIYHLSTINCLIMKVLLTLLFVLTATFAQAQSIIKSLERNIPGQGKVTIHQDPRIEALIGMERPATGEQKVIKTSGFRIQAYAGNNTRQAKNDAYHVASRVKEYFPELTVYTSFNPPRWLCRVGDFRSIEEADAMMRRLKATGVFKEVSIVRDQINIPL